MSSSEAPSPRPGAPAVSTRSGDPARPPRRASQRHVRGGRRAGYGIAGLPGGRRTKYVMVALWLAITAVPGVLAGGAAGPAGAFTGTGGTLLCATLAVITVVLLLTYRSPVMWLLPVVSAGAALISAEAVTYLLARHAGLTVSAQDRGILTVLVLGAGTGYALPVIARYREELRRHEDRHEAMAVALRRAGPAIAASAATVAAGMLCLLAAGPSPARALGVVAATGAGAGLLAMVTLLPALLVTALPREAGRRARWRGKMSGRRDDAPAVGETSGNMAIPVG